MMTQAEHLHHDVRPGPAYLQHLEELQSEIQGAMLAISGSSLTGFEESLWRQEVLCVSLSHLSHTLSSDTVESPLLARIRASSLALQDLNRSYGLLVQQSREASDMLLRLCRSYKDSGGHSSTSMDTRSAWTCEV